MAAPNIVSVNSPATAPGLTSSEHIEQQQASCIDMSSVWPNSFTHRVTDGHTTVAVEFVGHPVRSANFEVLVQDESGLLHPHQPAVGAGHTYLGRIADMPGAVAAGLGRADGSFLCRISFEQGVEWSSHSARGSIVANATVSGDTEWQPRFVIDAPSVGPGGAGSRVFAAEMGVDVTHSYFVTAGSGSVAATLEMVEFSVMAANLPFLRDAAVVHRLGKVVVRGSAAADPYAGVGVSGPGLSLVQVVREQWERAPRGTHQLATLVTHPLSVAGSAFSGVGVGTEWSYSVVRALSNGDFSWYWRLLAGLMWGATPPKAEEDIAEGPTIMAGNQLSRFSSADVALIVAHRNTKLSILQDLGPYAASLPPRANMDRVTLTNASLQVTHKMDLLENDSSSNGHSPLAIAFVPPMTALGGTIIRNPPSNDIIYAPPARLPHGVVDFFAYKIMSDPTAPMGGRTATGYVTVRGVVRDDLVLHWSLDEGAGIVAYDTSPSQIHGVVLGGTRWVDGHIRGAMWLDGLTGEVAASRGLNMSTDRITITGWVRSDGPIATNAVAGLALCRDRLPTSTVTNTTSAGIHLLGPNELRYHWGSGNNPSYRFSSGLTLSCEQWTFVALVISPTQATLYKKEPQGSLEFAHTPAGHTFDPQSFKGPFVLGNDHMVPGRHFKGGMDDFRIFRSALTNKEIAFLAENSSHGVPNTTRLPPMPITKAGILGQPEISYTTWQPPRAAEAIDSAGTFCEIVDPTPI
ncbi:hypothetical protein L7F22_037765 [Adiantum nelumboides]|nr:hypothetical protein [Adiantum nelumboides]MCO5583850.1 hypothetical protein [Adiantum nelumboides]